MTGFFGRTRMVGFGLLAVAFLVGALTGVAIDRAIDDADTERVRDRQHDDDDRGRSYIIDRVEMSESQRATIDSILERRTDRMRAVWREVEPRLDAITDSARSEIMDVLTAEQRAEYEAMLERRRRGRDHQGGSGGGGSAKHESPGKSGDRV